MWTPVRLFCLLALFALPAAAQDSPALSQDQSAPAPAPETPKKAKSPRETPKYEISAGYAYRSLYEPSGLSPYLNGWYASFDRNLFSWIGFEVEGMGVYKNQGVVTGNMRVYSFMGGPRIYPLRHRKFTPFGHVLYGVAILRNTVGPFGGFAQTTSTNDVKSWEAGGGFDYNVSRHWGIRIFEFDFGSSNFTGGSASQGVKRITVGIVYRFGQK